MVEDAGFETLVIVYKLCMHCFDDLAEEDWHVHGEAEGTEYHAHNVSPLLHACEISKDHTSDVAELEFAYDLVGIFVGTITADNGHDVSRGVHCLLRAITTERQFRECAHGFWEDEAEDIVSGEIHSITRYIFRLALLFNIMARCN